MSAPSSPSSHRDHPPAAPLSPSRGSSPPSSPSPFSPHTPPATAGQTELRASMPAPCMLTRQGVTNQRPMTIKGQRAKRLMAPLPGGLWGGRPTPLIPRSIIPVPPTTKPTLCRTPLSMPLSISHQSTTSPLQIQYHPSLILSFLHSSHPSPFNFHFVEICWPL